MTLFAGVLMYQLWNPKVCKANPVEALTAAVDQAVHDVPLASTFSTGVWVAKIVVAAAIGTLIYHVLTKLLFRKASIHGAVIKAAGKESIPAGSAWLSKSGNSSLVIDEFDSTAGVLSHVLIFGDESRTESWCVTGLNVVSENARNDFIATIVCPHHGGHSGTILVHRCGYNDLKIDVKFSDPELAAINATLKRQKG